MPLDKMPILYNFRNRASGWLSNKFDNRLSKSLQEMQPIREYSSGFIVLTMFITGAVEPDSKINGKMCLTQQNGVYEFDILFWSLVARTSLQIFEALY